MNNNAEGNKKHVFFSSNKQISVFWLPRISHAQRVACANRMAHYPRQEMHKCKAKYYISFSSCQTRFLWSCLVEKLDSSEEITFSQSFAIHVAWARAKRSRVALWPSVSTGFCAAMWLLRPASFRQFRTVEGWTWMLVFLSMSFAVWNGSSETAAIRSWSTCSVVAWGWRLWGASHILPSFL